MTEYVNYDIHIDSNDCLSEQAKNIGMLTVSILCMFIDADYPIQPEAFTFSLYTTNLRCCEQSRSVSTPLKESYVSPGNILSVYVGSLF